MQREWLISPRGKVHQVAVQAAAQAVPAAVPAVVLQAPLLLVVVLLLPSPPLLSEEEPSVVHVQQQRYAARDKVVQRTETVGDAKRCKREREHMSSAS